VLSQLFVAPVQSVSAQQFPSTQVLPHTLPEGHTQWFMLHTLAFVGQSPFTQQFAPAMQAMLGGHTFPLQLQSPNWQVSWQVFMPPP
jgi:hypothetical protein